MILPYPRWPNSPAIAPSRVIVNAGDGDIDDDARPWEQHGSVRRDCEPHRSGLLQLLAWASLGVGSVQFALALLTVILGAPPFVGFASRVLSGATLALALVLAVSARILARRDIKKMRAGVMDPAGEGPAWLARFVSLLGVAIGLLAAVMLLGEFGSGFGFFAVAVVVAFLFLLVAAALT
jgi:hypothetical protein